MRTSYLVGCIVLSFGMVTTFESSGTGSLAVSSTESTGSITQHVRTNAARVIAESLPMRGSAHIQWGSVPPVSLELSIAAGEKLPDFVELRPILNHETYRYAVVNNRRVIVDAVSREIVYVVQ
jgi:Protein of unknown function (DUF1236)